MLTKDFFSKNATFTVENDKGEWYTFKLREPRGKTVTFASLLAGPNNMADYVYVGLFDPTAFQVRLTKASRFNAESKPVRVLNWALATVRDGRELPEGYQIRHEGRCGRCGRVLTVPESLDSGIGPECREKMGLGGY